MNFLISMKYGEKINLFNLSLEVQDCENNRPMDLLAETIP